MSLIFIEDIHKYYIVEQELEQTDYKNTTDFEALNGPLEGREVISVTTLLHKYANEFNADAVLDKMLGGSQGTNLDGEPIYTGANQEYQGCTKAMIKQMWDIKREKACDYGTFIHLAAENFALEGDFKIPARPETRQVKNFFKESSFDIDTAELRIVDPELGIAGTVDLLLSKKVDGEDSEGNPDFESEKLYYIADWKTNDGKDLADKVGGTFTEKMKFPLQHLPDLPYWHYALQFSLYRFMLERQGMRVDGQCAVHLKREGNFPQVIEMPYLKAEIEAIVWCIENGY